MLQDSFSTAQLDMRARALAEARLDADRLLLATQTALDADSALLDNDAQSRILARMADLRASLSLDDPAAIEAVTKALSDGTQAFAAMRMNHGIQQALAGKNIETV
jgi:molecular chaperone HscA